MKEQTQKKKLFRIRFYAAACFIFIIMLLFCIFLLKDRKNSKEELKELKAKLAEMESLKIKTDVLKEEVKQISKYSAYEFQYTSIMCFSDQNQFMGIDIPLTKNNFVATIDGKMNIGIDGDKVDISTKTDSENRVTEVNLSVPHSEILDNYPIPESLEIYDEKNNIFNPVKVSDYNELVVEAQKQEEQKVLEGELLQQSDAAVENLLKSYFRAAFGDDVQINYEYLEDEMH